MNYSNIRLGDFYRNKLKDRIERIVCVTDCFQILNQHQDNLDERRVTYHRLIFVRPLDESDFEGLQTTIARASLDSGLVVPVPTSLEAAHLLTAPDVLYRLARRPVVTEFEMPNRAPTQPTKSETELSPSESEVVHIRVQES